MKFKFSGQIFEKYPDVKFHEKSSDWENISVRTDRPTDMEKLIVAFCKFSNALRTYSSNIYNYHFAVYYCSRI